MTTLVKATEEIGEVPEGHGVFIVLDSTGDTRHVWDRRNPDEVEEMRGLFRRMIDRGMQAFKVTRKGDKGEQIREFDPDAEAVIFSPALVGG